MENILGEEENRYLAARSTVFKCRECDETFSQPLVATVSSDGNSRTYYACPRCLSKVSDVKKPQSNQKAEQETCDKHGVRSAGRNEEVAKCRHFLGYLKGRSRDAAIPDECLTCERMVECLIR